MTTCARILFIAASAAALRVAAAEPTDISGTVTGPKGPEAPAVTKAGRMAALDLSASRPRA